MKKIKKVEKVEKVVKKVKKVVTPMVQRGYKQGGMLPDPSTNRAATTTCYNPPMYSMGCIGCICESECVCRIKYQVKLKPRTRGGKK